MARYYSNEVREPVAIADQANTATTAAEALLWPAKYSAFAADELRPGQLWEVNAGGVYTTAATPGTDIFQARFGTTTGGITFGVSNTVTLPVSATAWAWTLQYSMLVRQVSTPTTAGSGILVGNGFIALKNIATAADVNISFGGTTITTADTTVASGLIVTATPSVATQVWVTKYVYMRSLT